MLSPPLPSPYPAGPRHDPKNSVSKKKKKKKMPSEKQPDQGGVGGTFTESALPLQRSFAVCHPVDDSAGDVRGCSQKKNWCGPLAGRYSIAPGPPFSPQSTMLMRWPDAHVDKH